METRVSDRNESLSDLLTQLSGSRELERVPVNQTALANAVQAIIEATDHLQAAAGD